MTPQTFPECYRYLAVDAFSLLRKALAPQRFRLSPASAIKVDGLERTVSCAITAPATVTVAELDAQLRASLPAAIAALAARIKPCTVIGTIAHTAASVTDPVRQTPDTLTMTDASMGLVLLVHITKRAKTAAHVVTFKVLVGR